MVGSVAQQKKPTEAFPYLCGCPTGHGIEAASQVVHVSPIHAHIVERSRALSDFLVSLCAIVGGAVSVFGIVDGVLFAGTNAVKKNLGKNF